VAGEPIVTAALEGYSTFRRCGIDALVAGATVVTKRATPRPNRQRRTSRDQETRRHAAAPDDDGERRRIDCRPGARTLAARFGRTLARAARDLSLRPGPDPDRRRDRRSARAVHLRDLLSAVWRWW